MMNVPILRLFNMFFLVTYQLCEGLENYQPVSRGFGPYYVKTMSVDNCTSEHKLDTKNLVISETKVRKISRTKEEYVGNCTVPNDVQVIRGMAEFLVWQDGGFRTEFKKYFDHPCKVAGVSLILKKNFNPDKDCNIKKGIYKIDSLNTNDIMHLIFQSYHYNKYMFVLDWFSKDGSLGCFKTMCEVKPLKAPKMPRH